MGVFKDAITAIIGVLMLDFDDFLDKALDVLTMSSLSTDPIFSGAYTVAVRISDRAVKPTATSIIAICFLIEFLKLSLKMDMFKWEYAVSALAKFAIAKSALDIAPDFIMAIYGKGTTMITEAYSSYGFGGGSLFSTAWGSLETLMTSIGWVEALAMSSVLTIIFLAVYVAGIFILVMAYARMIEIIMYISVTPLAVAFVPLENSGITKKFALNFAAVVLQGVLMIVIIMIFNALTSDLLGSVTSSGDTWGDVVRISGTMLVVTLTLVTATVKSGSIAKSILGQG